jgi:hypothetical protein
MRVQTRTLQVPRYGAGAFSPCLTSGGAPATNGQNKISGQPGTVPVPSPRPAALNDGELGGPFNQPSAVAPNWFMPSIYTFHANPTVHFPGAIDCDNVMPTPTPNPGRTSLQWQHRVRVGGRTTTSAIRPFTTWPSYGGSST